MWKSVYVGVYQLLNWKMHGETWKNQQLISPSLQCSSTPVGFGQACLNKERCDNTRASHIFSLPGSSWLLPVPSIEISIGGTALLCCYWHHYECDGRAEKVSTQLHPGMFPTSLQSLAEIYNSARAVFWRNCSLSYYIVLYFSEMKWLR